MNFPDNPTVGQVYNKWYWDGAIWSRTHTDGTSTIVGPPSSPLIGQRWIDTDNGSEFWWTGEEWVELGAAAVKAKEHWTQPTPPVNGFVGQHWVDTDNGREFWWTGGEWVELGAPAAVIANDNDVASYINDPTSATNDALEAHVDAHQFQNGVMIGTGGISITAGVNTPEGAVIAPVGSLFLRSNGAANTTLYIKQTGTGNTGWFAVTP